MNIKKQETSTEEPSCLGSTVASCYTLSLTEEQIKTLSMACETMARLYMGQMDMLGNVRSDHFISSDDAHAIKRLVFPELVKLGSGHGINSEKLPDESRQLWDCYQVLRNFLAWKDASNSPSNRDWKKQMGVSFDEPMRTSDEPLPIVAEV